MTAFDLERAVRAWKKNYAVRSGLEETHLTELEENLREEIEELAGEGLGEEEAFRRATANLASPEVMGSEFFKVRSIRGSGRPSWQAPRFLPALPRHYVKIFLRKISRQMSYSLINVAGLAVGMACFLLILAVIQFEASYDRFHEKSERLFRVAVRGGSPDAGEYSLSTPEILSRVMPAEIPEIVGAGIAQRSMNARLQAGPRRFRESGLFTDPNFFRLFSFQVLSGDPARALAAPGSIVLCDRLAEKIFGSRDPIGQWIKFTGRYLDGDLRVTGIVKSPPRNSHLQFDYLISAATLAANEELAGWFNDWDTYAFLTYVELRDERAAGPVERKIEAVIREGRPKAGGTPDAVFLQPVRDIHLKSRVVGETAANNRIQSIRLMGAIALIILLVAGINSMNLSTARASTRIKEICLRKVIGAGRSQLIRQFLGESFLFAGLALGLALVLFFLLFPLAADFLVPGLTWTDVNKLPLALGVLATLLFVGAFSGLYPAFALSDYLPIVLFLKQPGGRPKGVKIRNALVVVQFSAAIVLLVGTLVIGRQLRFIKTKNLGFDRDRVVMVSLEDEAAKSLAGVLKTRLGEHHLVRGVTVSDSSPLALRTSIGGASVQRDDGETVKIDFHLAGVDDDFIGVYGIKIAEGRNFSPRFPGDAEGILVNQALVREIGWKNPIGKKLLRFTVIGVVEDFHFATLHKEIEPAVLSRQDTIRGRVLLGIRFEPGDAGGALAGIKEVCARVAPGQPLAFEFLDDAYDGQYRNERQLAAAVGALEGLAILLAGMGLFGLATYAAERRAKEIGIRKVLGASSLRIVRMISAEFLGLVLAANLIAWPLGYLFMRNWLQDYAYRCPLGIDVFVTAALGTMLLALFAVGFHTLKSSLANPLDSIRCE